MHLNRNVRVPVDEVPVFDGSVVPVPLRAVSDPVNSLGRERYGHYVDVPEVVYDPANNLGREEHGHYVDCPGADNFSLHRRILEHHNRPDLHMDQADCDLGFPVVGLHGSV